ncbi:MAG: aminoglycoside phosphotransferase family protein [Bacillaceae bacterium]|nr:aminoglycoside phosphotransferase family protein [Bacillaceae bacterium]
MNITRRRMEEMRGSIYSVLNTLPGWNIQTIDFIGNGVVNAVFLVYDKNFGKLAVRTPWNTENNMDNHSNDVISLKKEAEIVHHCYNYDIPVPKVHQLYLSEEINFLVSDFVSGDNDAISSLEIGQLVSKIHNVPTENLNIIDQGNLPLTSIISKRITERNLTLCKLINTRNILPDQMELESVLNLEEPVKSLLHLDVRPPNIIAEKGKIQAILDWDNAFIGHPIMELMRICESKELDVGDFLKGYNNNSIIEKTEEVIQLLYRLDTALMLAILFVSIIKDIEKATYYINRVELLSKEIRNII